MINRGVLIARPRQPFLDWAASLDDSGILPDPKDEQTVYLIPDFAFESEAQEMLKQVFSTVFENELYSWHTEQADWPKNRTWKMFQEWFSIEFHSVVEDLCGYEIVDDRDT